MPVDELAIVGDAPLILNAVAFDKVTVAFAIVAVPVDAPNDKVVAAPPIDKLVAVALNKVAVAADEFKFAPDKVISTKVGEPVVDTFWFTVVSPVIVKVLLASLTLILNVLNAVKFAEFVICK